MAGTTRIFGFHPVHEALLHRKHEVRRVWILAARQGVPLAMCRAHEMSRKDFRLAGGP